LTTATVFLLFLPAIAFSTTPTAFSVTPSSGTGTVQSFALAYSDPAGVSDLSWVYALFSPNGDGANACGVYYHPAWNLIYLGDDANSKALGPGAVGNPGHLSNSQCTIDVGASSTSVAGNTLTLNVAVYFHVTSAFKGPVSVYMYAQDRENNSSSFLKRGTWTVDSKVWPVNVSVSPSSGSGPAQVFSLTWSNGNGLADLDWVSGLVRLYQNFNGYNQCQFWLSPRDGRPLIYLISDVPYTPGIGPGILGQPGTIKNAECTLDLGASSMSRTLNTVTLNLSINFPASQAGPKKMWLWAENLSQEIANAPQGFGTYTVQFPSFYAVSATPGVASLTHTNQRTFTVTFSNANGGSGIDWAYVLFTPNNDSAHACPIYVHASGLVYLGNDQHNAVIGPEEVGSPGTLSNSQCTVDVGSASMTVGSKTLAIDLPVTFAPAFNGTLNVITYAEDDAGLNTGFQTINAYTVSAPVAPNYVFASQNGVVAPALFTRYAEANGYQDMKTLYFLVGTWLNTAASCQVRYEMADNTIYLSDDAGGWKGPASPGVPGSLTNNECTIDTGNSLSQPATSSDPTSWDFTVPITHFAAARGAFQNVFMNAVDKEGNSAGWVYRGTWTVP